MDDWQDTYGLDAVRAFYHSGHGGMDSAGVFYAPLGSSWSTHDAWARSNQMKFANQHLRYMFWSTCFSCRVLDGQNPFKTWGNANNGLRMLFGYESTSVDAGNYGSAFWKHWNQGKSFSQAWLDASWYDISHNQAPSAFACGSSAADAANRLNTERHILRGRRFEELVSMALVLRRCLGAGSPRSQPETSQAHRHGSPGASHRHLHTCSRCLQSPSAGDGRAAGVVSERRRLLPDR